MRKRLWTVSAALATIWLAPAAVYGQGEDGQAPSRATQGVGTDERLERSMGQSGFDSTTHDRIHTEAPSGDFSERRETDLESRTNQGKGGRSEPEGPRIDHYGQEQIAIPVGQESQKEIDVPVATPQDTGTIQLPGDSPEPAPVTTTWSTRGGAVDAATTGTVGMGVTNLDDATTGTAGMGTRTLIPSTTGASAPATGWRTTDRYWRKVPARDAADYSPHLYGPNAYWRETNAYWEDDDWFRAKRPDVIDSRTNKGKGTPDK